MSERVVVTGLNGFIGQGFQPRDLAKFEVHDFYRSEPALQDVAHHPVDLTKIADLKVALAKIDPAIILHMASVTHIDRCQADKTNGKNGLVWKVNVDASKTIADYASASGAYIVYLSTECVFDGEAATYTERASKNPKNWYGLTKSLAEDHILQLPNAAVIRSVIAYDRNLKSNSIFGAIGHRLKQCQSVSGVSDQMMTPTYKSDIVKAINLLLINRYSGVFHVASPEQLAPYQFAERIARHYGFDPDLIESKTLIEHFGQDRARLRLRNSCLDGQQTNQLLGFEPRTIDQVLNCQI